MDGLVFVVVDLFPFIPSYEPELDDATVGALGLAGPEDVELHQGGLSTRTPLVRG